MPRHEQQSIRMALATVMHHSYKVHTEYGALRGLKTATRAGKEGREEHDALRRQRPPPLQPELFQLYEEEPGGSRLACLVAPRGPQEAVQRHTVEQLADVVPMVQVLDAPGLLGEVGVVDFFRELDAPALDELVIAVPKFYLPRIPRRCPRRRPRRAEQLVEVPKLSADFTPSTPAAYVDSIGPPTWVDDAGFAWWQSESGRWFLDRDPSIWWDAPG